MAIVEVRPIEKESWHRKHGKDSFKRPVTIEALISINTGQFATGLNEKDRERLEKATGQNLSPDYMAGKPHEFWNSPAAAAIKRQVVIESSKLTKSRKAEIVQILSGVSVKGQSDNYVDWKLDEEIKEHGPEKVLIILQRDTARTSLHAFVLEALQKNILRKQGAAVLYMDDQIGFDLEAAIDYFADKKNQALKAQILEKINE